jgi:hypothetical protein
MFDEEQLRRLTPEERLSLMRTLAVMDISDMPSWRAGERRHAIALAAIIICCVVLAAWTGLLAVTLPHYYRAGGWRGAWVGFDVALLGAFAAVGWASWRRRQALIICLIVLATLLCCDAWFDVVLDARTSGFWMSVASAVVIELPLAALAIAGAHRLLKMTSHVLLRYQGHAGPLPPFRAIPLVGTRQDRPLSDLLCTPQEMPGTIAGHEAAGPNP